MNFYTSYYANLKNIPMDFACIGISRICPEWLSGDKVQGNFYFFDDNPFAPSIDLLSDIKSCKIDQREYTIRFYRELNERFNFKSDRGNNLRSYLEDLKRRFFDYSNIVFLCYEKPEEFCHRHLLRDLLLFYKVPISELPVDKTKDKSKVDRSSQKHDDLIPISNPLF